MTEIRTKRLLLRPARETDVTDLHPVFSSAEAMRYWSSLPHARISLTEEFVGGLVARGPDTRYFVVEYQGRAIGAAGFWNKSEIGYILHPDLWRQGLGAEVVRALIPFGFDTCGFDHILADVDPDNAASLGMLAKAGFVETGRRKKTLQVGANWVDSVYLRLDREAET